MNVLKENKFLDDSGRLVRLDLVLEGDLLNFKEFSHNIHQVYK